MRAPPPQKHRPVAPGFPVARAREGVPSATPNRGVTIRPWHAPGGKLSPGPDLQERTQEEERILRSTALHRVQTVFAWEKGIPSWGYL